MRSTMAAQTDSVASTPPGGNVHSNVWNRLHEPIPALAHEARTQPQLLAGPVGQSKNSSKSYATVIARHSRETIRTLWSRVPPALQLLSVFRTATERQMRRSPDGGIIIKSAVAVLG